MYCVSTGSQTRVTINSLIGGSLGHVNRSRVMPCVSLLKCTSSYYLAFFDIFYPVQIF